VVGGYLAGSLAVMTDAAHLSSDFVGFLVSLFAIWIGRQAPTRRFSFGYFRAGNVLFMECYVLD
jgi:zinc transporter 2